MDTFLFLWRYEVFIETSGHELRFHTLDSYRLDTEIGKRTSKACDLKWRIPRRLLVAHL